LTWHSYSCSEASYYLGYDPSNCLGKIPSSGFCRSLDLLKEGSPSSPGFPGLWENSSEKDICPAFCHSGPEEGDSQGNHLGRHDTS